MCESLWFTLGLVGGGAAGLVGGALVGFVLGIVAGLVRDKSGPTEF
jgi:LytS/YehU family sensor histidine kinase